MNGPIWAEGCKDCTRGLVTPPPPSKLLYSIYDARRIQAKAGELIFCTCQAGQSIRRHLLRDESGKVSA